MDVAADLSCGDVKGVLRLQRNSELYYVIRTALSFADLRLNVVDLHGESTSTYHSHDTILPATHSTLLPTPFARTSGYER